MIAGQFLLAPIVIALLVVVASPVAWAGVLEDAEEYVRRNPNDAEGHRKLGGMYYSIASQIELGTRSCLSGSDCSDFALSRDCERPLSCSEGYEKQREQLLKAIAL